MDSFDSPETTFPPRVFAALPREVPGVLEEMMRAYAVPVALWWRIPVVRDFSVRLASQRLIRSAWLEEGEFTRVEAVAWVADHLGLNPHTVGQWGKLARRRASNSSVGWYRTLPQERPK